MLELTRGDAEDIEVDDLTDENGDPTTFGASDVLIWSAKHHYGDTAVLLQKTSEDGGIDIDVGQDSATIHIVPDDWEFALAADLDFVWDLQWLSGGDPDTAQTIASGDGLIHVDVAGNPVLQPGALGAPGGVTCTPWATAEDVLPPLQEEADQFELALACQMASDILYDLTKHRWKGVCVDDIRPLAKRAATYASGWWPTWGGVGYRYGWCSCNRTTEYGCASVPQIVLPGYPVVADSVEVTIDGDPFTDFRVVDRRKLVRTDGDGWPCCQDLTLDPGDDGTWSVRYSWGIAPPPAGRRSAALLAANLYRAMHPEEGGACELPDHVSSLVRQGVTISMDPSVFSDGHTGIRVVDMWIDSVLAGDKARCALIVPGMTRSAARTN